ncbi:uncharacterized protein PAC_19756 [Phialocephala subalpina]|uniref:Uncharacterized protein n=1 Tax=Phialocephala subalpina TaxID=576137 RepID=A0A1L7XY04_9HELO|nr:uncharacterized protein PAC_19756 [Phialocephala subalpina]
MMPDFNSTLKQPSCPNAIVQRRPERTFTPQRTYFSTRTNFLLSHAYGPEEEDANTPSFRRAAELALKTASRAIPTHRLPSIYPSSAPFTDKKRHTTTIITGGERLQDAVGVSRAESELIGSTTRSQFCLPEPTYRGPKPSSDYHGPWESQGRPEAAGHDEELPQGHRS